MTVRLLLSALFLGLMFTPLFSQTFRPLAGYEQLREPVVGKPRALDKAVCGDFDLTGLNVVLPGATRGIKLRPDTVALDGVGFNDYRCEGCAEVNFGTAFVRSDSLFYGADAGAEFGLDTVSITACDAAGTCSGPLQVVILVRREGREISLGALNLAPRARTEVVVPTDQVPGGATCRGIATCSVNYSGRAQVFDFLTGQNDGNDFFYEASGYGGTDVVCVTLCNDFGLCDVYKASFTITVPSVNLPFFDDFSYDGIRPAGRLWQDEDVLINRNFAVDPPSIGVATFDGVTFDGQPYPTGGGGRTTVIRDYLTSAPVNLAGRNGINLNFYLQPRGLGNRPETQDSFLVQFLDQSGNWNTVFRQAGLLNTVGNATPVPFTGQTITVPGQYLYNGFQFRFASKSSEQGAVDMWHLDYVKLGFGLVLNTADVALTELPGYVLNAPYTSIPLRHLRAGGEGLLVDSFRIAIRNNFNDTRNVETESSQFAIINPANNNNLARQNFGTVFPNLTGGSSGSNSVPADTLLKPAVPFTSLDSDNQQRFSDFLLSGASEDTPLKLNLLYDLTIRGQDTTLAGGGVFRNDSLVSQTCFDEYMAYDDGSAEVAIEVQEGTTILQRFEAFVADELTGIRVRIPRGLGGLGDQQVRLVVYTGEAEPAELIGSYDFDIVYAETFFRDSLQGYTTYRLPENLPVGTGSFYVGWEQQRAGRSIGVGFDRNSTPEGVQWFNTGSGWNRLTGTTTGAIMVRPLLAGFDGFTTSTATPAANEPLIDVYPNPTNGTLHLRPRPNTGTAALSYRLYALTGALLGESRLTDRLEIGHLPPGLYLLEVTDGNVSSRHKIVRR